MRIINFPKWDLSILINLCNQEQTKFIDKLIIKYQDYLLTQNIELNHCSKLRNFDKYFRFNNIKDSFYNNSSKENKQIIEDIINSKKIGVINCPENYLFLNYIKQYPNKDKDLDSYSVEILHNCKKDVWNSNDYLQPQWYLISDNSNQSICDDYFKNNILVFEKYIPVEIFQELKNEFTQELFNKEEKKLKKQIEDNITSIENYELITHYIYQNDYYFIKSLQQNDYKLDYHKIKELNDSDKKKTKPPIFTIITPTMGSNNLYRLKQILKQESISYIHLILWDKNRRGTKDGNLLVNPKDLEDENTYCYQFMHPYFEFKGQRNDVWLRGVGATLTNTPYVTYFDDDTWPERNHLDKVMKYMTRRNLNYTYAIRRMWKDSNTPIGIDNFEAIGVKNKFGFRLIDNSSLYMKLEVARKVMNVFLNHQVYGDDRLTPDFLDNDKECKGERMEEVLVNHIAKDVLLKYFKDNVTPETFS
jgi:hypothetical protein